jgi:hypothetical protein
MAAVTFPQIDAPRISGGAEFWLDEISNPSWLDYFDTDTPLVYNLFAQDVLAGTPTVSLANIGTAVESEYIITMRRRRR